MPPLSSLQGILDSSVASGSSVGPNRTLPDITFGSLDSSFHSLAEDGDAFGAAPGSSDGAPRRAKGAKDTARTSECCAVAPVTPSPGPRSPDVP